MHNPALGSKEIFAPKLLNVDQCTLPLTEHKVLQGRELNQIVFGVWH